MFQIQLYCGTHTAPEQNSESIPYLSLLKLLLFFVELVYDIVKKTGYFKH
jgi:hypothetical protein